ncbi:MAG: hypothetical protein QG670_2486 [Thermoproteota archaeon]|nr:hypothetical protein [Thermoproteota archaeon]
MDSEGILQYFKMMIPSLFIMVIIAFGMATENVLLQYGAIGLILVGQIGYQTIKSFRSAPMVEANIKEATKAKGGRLLLTVTENEVNEIKKQVKDSSGMGISSKQLLTLFIPIIVFYATSQILGSVVPDLPRWQSYLIAFALTLPASTVVAMKSGTRAMTGPAVSPNAYYISEKGVIFEYFGRTYIMPFPIKRINMQKEKMYIEVEGRPTKSVMIPNKLKLLSKQVEKLQSILNRFLEEKTEKAIR